jgi:hypothetical protein
MFETPRIHAALWVLAEAAAGAANARADLWQFSIRIPALRRLGLSITECRWLVAKGLAVQAVEVTEPDDDLRVFRAGSNLSFARRTCFIITDAGLKLGKASRRSEKSVSVDRHRRARLSKDANGAATSHAKTLTPTWDADRRQLRVGRLIAKAFKVPAADQETILATFHEENWPVRIDDPLSPKANLDANQRLADAINLLNCKQRPPLIRFFPDGEGRGIRWEFAKP